MDGPIVGQIQPFAFNFAPRNWAFCNGAALPISQHQGLYSLIGPTYGGDGKTVFLLPNFTGRAGCSQGAAPGVTPRQIGETFGENEVTLATPQMPAHSHAFTIYDQPDPGKRSNAPESGSSLTVPFESKPYAKSGPDARFAPQMVGAGGAGMPHENRQPFLALNYCIAIAGGFPDFD